MSEKRTVAENKTPFATVYDVNVIGLIIFTISLLGTTANLIVAVFTKKLPTMNNPFGRLSASQSTGEAVLCAIFCFYFSPMVFFKRNTQVMITITWIIAICTSTTFHKLYDCDVYSPLVWAFVFSRNPTCDLLTTTISFYKDITIVSIIGVLDLVTILNVHRTNKSVSDTSEGQRARRKREINFLKQAILQATVFAIELFTYFFFAWKFENKWVIWTLTTFAWISVHTIDGWIIILFNSEFRRLIASPLSKLGGATAGFIGTSVKERLATRENDYTATVMTTNEK